MKSFRIVAVTFAVAAIGVGFAPIAHAAPTTKTTTLAPSTGGWYQFNPTCEVMCVATDSLPDLPFPISPPTTAYPAGSLHVGYGANIKLAEAFIGYNFSELLKPPTAGTLTLPVDTSPADGSAQANTAHMEVCVVSEPVGNVDGSLDTPPAANCKHAVAMKYVAKPTEHFTANIKPLLKGIVNQFGFEIQPDPKTVSLSDAWMVAFNGPSRTGVKSTTLPTLGLTVPVSGKTGTTTTTTTTTTAKQPPSVVGLSPGGSTVPQGSGSTSINLPPTQVTTTNSGGSAPQVAGNSPSTSTPQSETTEPAAHIVRFGYAYPIVWVLPLLFLLLIPLVGRVLTSDMTVIPGPARRSARSVGPSPDDLLV